MPRKKTTKKEEKKEKKSTKKTSPRESLKSKEGGVSSKEKRAAKPRRKTTKETKKREALKGKAAQERTIKYKETIGRRKTSSARVRLYEDEKERGKIIINKRTLEEYFPVFELQKTILAPIEKTENFILNKGKIEILVKGGGSRGQAEAIQLGIARLILKVQPKYKDILKSHGFLKRDPRVVERKKFGLKKARRAPQWQKR